VSLRSTVYTKCGRETRDYEQRIIFIGPAGEGDMLLPTV